MEALTRLVSESFARHGFDRPIDYRRLKWSRWFRCESHHSLLFVPSKPGVFALAEELRGATNQGAADTLVRRAEQDSTSTDKGSYRCTASAVPLDGQDRIAPLAADGRRTLAITQFFEADDMAFTLDRMLSRYNPMRARLESGRYFIRFVIIEDESQRSSIYSALNQWIHSSGENNTGIGRHFAASLAPTPTIEPVAAPDDSQANLFSSAEMGRVIFSAHVAGPAHAGTTASAVQRSEATGSAAAPNEKQSAQTVTAPRPSGADSKIQSPPAFPSGF